MVATRRRWLSGRWLSRGRYPGAIGRILAEVTQAAEVEDPPAGQDIEDNPKMQPLIHPSESLNIELKDPEVDVTDGELHKLILIRMGGSCRSPRTTTMRGCGALE